MAHLGIDEIKQALNSESPYSPIEGEFLVRIPEDGSLAGDPEALVLAALSELRLWYSKRVDKAGAPVICQECNTPIECAEDLMLYRERTMDMSCFQKVYQHERNSLPRKERERYDTIVSALEER